MFFSDTPSASCISVKKRLLHNRVESQVLLLAFVVPYLLCNDCSCTIVAVWSVFFSNSDNFDFCRFLSVVRLLSASDPQKLLLGILRFSDVKKNCFVSCLLESKN